MEWIQLVERHPTRFIPDGGGKKAKIEGWKLFSPNSDNPARLLGLWHGLMAFE